MVSLANPTRFLELAGRAIPWLTVMALALLGLGLLLVFFVGPAMFGYMLIPSAPPGTLIWRHPLADVAAKTAAPIGATFCFIALVTGSLWGEPLWGPYWGWDARLTSMLGLFLLFL